MVEGVGHDDGRRRVVERERGASYQRGEHVGERIARQGAGGKDDGGRIARDGTFTP